MSRRSEKLRLVLADDHAVVVMGLEAVLSLEPDFEIVATAEDGRAAVEAYRKHLPHLILLDLRMPGMDGLDAAREIRREFPEAKILFLTSYETEDEIQRALSCGAAGYALKRSKGAELVQAIRTVAAGGKWLPEGVIRRAREAAEAPVLSERQREVLSLVSKGLSNKEIAGVLGFTESGTKQHLRQIFAKLGVTGRAEAISEAAQRGILKLGE